MCHMPRPYTFASPAQPSPDSCTCRTVPEIQFGAYSVYAQQKGLITAAQALVLQQVRQADKRGSSLIVADLACCRCSQHGLGIKVKASATEQC